MKNKLLVSNDGMNYEKLMALFKASAEANSSTSLQVQLPWATGLQNGKCDGRFLQIGNSLLFADQVKQLPGEALRLYMAMMNEAAGHKQFEFTQARAKQYGMSTTAFHKNVKLLEQRKFIKIDSGWNTRTPNRYEFIFDWKSDKTNWNSKSKELKSNEAKGTSKRKIV